MEISLSLIFLVTFLRNIARGMEFDEQRPVTKSIEDMSYDYEDEKNSMIATLDTDDIYMYDDFYDEFDNWIRRDRSMNVLFFGPTSSFMRLDSETILHILVHTKKHLIPISRVLLAWDIITDGKTAAFLQGREFLAFGSLLNVVPEEDLYYVNFGDPSVLKFFSKYNISLRTRKLGVLVAAYRRYYGHEWFKNGSYVNELGYLVCGFPPVDLALITPEVFKELNVELLNKLGRCTIDQTRALYKIATHPDCYGKPYKWSSHEISRLNMLFTCIPEREISSVQLEAITAITPEVMRKINQNKLEYFTKQQILRMHKKTRRDYILRMQLKISLDMSQLGRGSMLNALEPLFPVIIISVVTLLLG